MAAHLVRRAADFDVIVTENIYGDTLSDLAGELVGSLGLAPSLNANEHIAMAQAAHGSAPDIAGLNIANPTGIISSAAMLLRWLAEKHTDHKLADVATTVECALYQTLQDDVKTKDLGGHASTSDFTEAILDKVHSLQK